MGEARAYTGNQFALAVSLAGVLGWAAIAIPATASYSAGPVPMSAALGFLLWAGIIGLPVALVSSWVVAGPILWRVMARPVGWQRAVVWGLIVPATMVVIGLALGRLMGFLQFLNPRFNSTRYGAPGVAIEIDGILQPHGWWLVAQSTARFVAIGFVVAMIVRAVVGPGSALSGAIQSTAEKRSA